MMRGEGAREDDRCVAVELMSSPVRARWEMRHGRESGVP